MVHIMDIKPLEEGHFSINISLGNWNLSKEVSDRDLEQLQEAISEARGLSKIKADFSCTTEEATKIRDAWGYGDSRVFGKSECKNCPLKGVECYKCLFVCQSPLEQAMFWEFRKRGIDVVWVDQEDAIIAAFEVECTTDITKGIYRMGNLRCALPSLNTALFLVIPKDRVNEACRKINVPLYKKVLKDKIRIITIEDLDDVMSMIKRLPKGGIIPMHFIETKAHKPGELYKSEEFDM